MTHTELGGEIDLTSARFVAAADVCHLDFSEFRPAVVLSERLAPECHRMPDIPLLGDVLQVGDPVIEPVSILVVRDEAGGARAKERIGDEPVNEHGPLPTPVREALGQIASRPHAGLEDVPNPSTVARDCGCALDAPEVGDGEGPVGHVLPCFHIGILQYHGTTGQA